MDEQSVKSITPRSFPGKEFLTVILIFALALALRLWHLIEMKNHSPSFLIPVLDEQMYFDALKAITAGDYFVKSIYCSRPVYPWLLYPFFLISGGSIFFLKLVNMTAGAASCAVIYLIGKKLFDRKVAVAAGVLSALYLPFIFFSEMLLAETFSILFGFAAVYLIIGIDDKSSYGRPILAGLLFALGVVLRPHFLPLLFTLPFSLYFSSGIRGARRLASFVLAFMLGACMVSIPVAVRNKKAFGDYLIIHPGGGINLYVTNNPEATGMWVTPRPFHRSQADSPKEIYVTFKNHAEKELGKELTEKEMSVYWRGEAFDFIRKNPVAYLRVLGKKMNLIVTPAIVSDINSFYLYRQFSRVLRLPLITFLSILPLGILGLIISIRKIKKMIILHLFLTLDLILLLLLFGITRYRLTLVPVMMLFSACSLEWIYERIRAKRFLSAAAFFISFAVLLLLFGVNYSHYSKIRGVDYFNFSYSHLIRGDFETARKYLEKSITLDETYLSSHVSLAVVLEKMGQNAEALEEWKKVMDLAVRYSDEKMCKEALRHLERLGIADSEL